MAQWMGQFSGHTHETKVEDAEATLRQAVSALRSAGSSLEREGKAKAVNRLAKRLLAARLKMIKARVAGASDVQSGGMLSRRADEIESLKQKHEVMKEGGLDAILLEFGVQDDMVI